MTRNYLENQRNTTPVIVGTRHLQVMDAQDKAAG